MAKTHEKFLLEISKISPEIEILGYYTKSTDRINVQCKQCGYIWQPFAYSLSQGKSCPHCSAKRGAKNNKGKTALKSHEQFLAEMATKQPSIIICDEYVNGHTNIKCACSICSHQWSAKPYSLLQNHGCPRCARSGTSFMEQFIRLCFVELLGNEMVLSRDKTIIGMELDIYIPSLKLAIEPGSWHFHKYSVERDRLKREKCNRLGISCITIYDMFPSELTPPFNDNCFVFKEDLNKANRNILKNLICILFDNFGLTFNFSESQWQYIESESYKHTKARTDEDFIRIMDSIHPNIKVLSKYQNVNTRLRVKCNHCQHEWDAVPANLLSGNGCKQCGILAAHAKVKKAHDIFVEQVLSINPDIQILSEYTGRHNQIRAKCTKCGYEWNPVAASLLRGSSHKGWKLMHNNISKR